MPTDGGSYYSTRVKKPWRYPGVPIPWRLQDKYEDKTR